ncbi:B3 domain-containing transcription factor VRN1 [Cannabis sativa]|uniref:B3 domain-containing transcription factor VRN1 n=1 Tax=Cannabis sativa TaxID=3483 RepID=UPI0029CA8560|nr:B3 domain-containing transcription factor VRN1 [Cannabis sativa]
MLSSKNPQFFKIILEHTLNDNKLRVPPSFVKKCGEAFTESVFVKLPCGSKWKMKLENYKEKFWLEEGWPEFVKHYSIETGYMLTFRYDGNSEIYVIIFGTNNVEIDYPTAPVNFCKSSIDNGKLRVPKREVIDNVDSFEILDDISSCPKTGVKSSCSQPSKRMKTNPPGKLDSPSKSNGDRFATYPTKKMTNGIRKTMKSLTHSEKIVAFQRTNDFTSEHPFFKTIMQPYYILGRNLTFPQVFAQMYLNNYRFCDVTLKVQNENKSWRLKYTYTEHKIAQPRFQGGWQSFVVDNNLKVGDVCVFVLLNATDNILFEVVIFRAEESSKDSVGTTYNEVGTPGFFNSSSEKQEFGKQFPSTFDERVTSTEKDSSSEKQEFGKQLPSTFNERVKSIEKDAIENENPFFKTVIQTSNKWHVRVPLEFADKHIIKEGDMVLAIPNGGQWPAQFKRRTSYTTGKSAAVIYDGWNEFMTENALEVGDVCIFELLNRAEIVLYVSIVRVSDFLKQERSQVNNSTEGEKKPKGDVRVKIETDS